MVEVHVFVDVSGSMRQSIDGMVKHEIRKILWGRLTPEIDGHPSRITAFSGKDQDTEVGPLKPRTNVELDALNIPEINGSTYLWAYLVDEGRTMSHKAKDCIILLITDGMDEQSPPPYAGSGGLGPCVEELNKNGFETDFHIIGIGLDKKAIAVYKQLSGASGGRFWNINSREDLERVGDEAQEHLGRILKDPESRTKESTRIKEEYERNRKPSDIEVFPTTPTTSGKTSKNLPVTRIRSKGKRSNLQKWLEEYVRSLGHEDVNDEDSLVARVRSKALPLGKKKRASHDWWAINAKDLDNLSEVDFLKLLIEVLKSIPRHKRHIIIVGMSRTTDRIDKLKDELKEKKNVDVIIFPKGVIDPAPIFPFPHPWPSPSPIRPGPTDPDSDWNAVPGFPDDECRPGIVVCPVVECNRLRQLEWEPRPWRIRNNPHLIEFLDDPRILSLLEDNCFGNENQHEWMPDRDIGHKVDPEHKHQWEMMRKCFCAILEDGFLHILHCYLVKKGTKNNTVVLELTEMGRLLGLDNHPCVKCFFKKINSLSDYGKQRGWPRIMDYVRYS